MGLYVALHSWPKLIGFLGSMDTLSKKVDILQNENLKHILHVIKKTMIKKCTYYQGYNFFT
jgi:hypothetical protein